MLIVIYVILIFTVLTVLSPSEELQYMLPALSSWLEVDLQCEEEDQFGLFLFSSNSDNIVHESFCSDSVCGAFQVFNLLA
jgi:hypothetical protein